MADPVPESQIFKFVSLRPPTSIPKADADAAFIHDGRPAAETQVGKVVAELVGQGADAVQTAVTNLVDQSDYRRDFPQSAGDTRLFAVEAAMLAIPHDQVTTQRVEDDAAQAIGQPVAAFVASDEATKTLADVWDRYEAFHIRSFREPQNLDQLTRNLRVIHLLNRIAAGATPSTAAELDTVLQAAPVLDQLFAGSNVTPKPTEPRGEPGPSEETKQVYSNLWTDLVETHRAIEEVRTLRLTTDVKSTTEQLEQPNRETGVATRTKVTRVTSQLRVDPSSYQSLAARTRAILGDLDFKRDAFDPSRTVGDLNMRMANLTSAVAAIRDRAFIEMMPTEAKQSRVLSGLASPWAPYFPDSVPLPRPEDVRGSIKPLGIGDLKVVKQRLRKYVAGEVAHIENVLRGEYKERKHRVLDRTEEIITIEEETEEETTKETQTTERFELKKESEKTIQEQMSLQAGVTVSGSYGPVTIGAHGDFAYSTATQESNKSASNFAREVIDKSVSRIQTRKREERVSKRLHEVEELNTHGIDNKEKPDHVTGIYRWVDKYYDAQIYNYGKRLMFEFVIPEPAAFIEFAQTHQPKKKFLEPTPLPANFTHSDITEWNYQTYISAYQVQGVTPPPPEYRVMTAGLASEAKMENATSMAKSIKDLVVPDGYVAVGFGASLSFIYEYHPQLKVSIGNDAAVIWHTNNTARRRQDYVLGSIGDYDGPVPVSITCYDVHSFFLNVAVTCHRRWEKYETWQIQTFEKIVAAYQVQVATYEQKVAAQETSQGIVIHGQNPGINRQIEKNEFKKHCVQLLQDTWTFGSYNAMKQASEDSVPDFDIVDAVTEGRDIQFFEQAFEWENLTYLLYPYFWGRRSQWVHKATTFDTDPLFTQFLQAGSSRVLVPVRPGYNDAVMYFLEHGGAIWAGGDPPKLNDPMFISIADELRNQTDDLGKATPEGESWEVVLPTTLVYLQQDATLPTFP